MSSTHQFAFTWNSKETPDQDQTMSPKWWPLGFCVLDPHIPGKAAFRCKTGAGLHFSQHFPEENRVFPENGWATYSCCPEIGPHFISTSASFCFLCYHRVAAVSVINSCSGILACYPGKRQCLVTYNPSLFLRYKKSFLFSRLRSKYP